MRSVADLEFFITLCKVDSLAQAGRDLDISSAAVSKRLSGIENALGCQLISRDSRSMSLTADGHVFLEYAYSIINSFDKMTAEIGRKKNTPEGVIRINAPFGFGRKHMAQFISKFVEEYPKIEFKLYLSDHPLSLTANSFDLGVRFGELADSGLHARKVASHKRVVCATPGYLKKYGTPKHPNDLKDHSCIMHNQNEEIYSAWRFENNNEYFNIRIKGNLVSNDGGTVLGWALNGHGIAIRAEWDVYSYIKDGTLIRIMEDFSLPNADIYILYPYNNKNLPLRIRIFIDYLIKEMQAMPFLD
ncbi:hypothetical protein BTW10_14060 [Chromohalobacter japonicus]|uniref:HTH lysR-type domain-containing protein n=1 Tax=Chromohalobacter japonicus TaxID=223900 RepID=A0A1Q8TA34_9GAMM|nr:MULTISPECIES: LysR family transcriptional regulator [Chromohalobacter]OLO10478.1 hypothetical protein BTW10_14060 [Chromohalobacter japonicus]